VVASDDVADQALLFLEEPVDVEPLPIVRRRQSRAPCCTSRAIRRGRGSRVHGSTNRSLPVAFPICRTRCSRASAGVPGDSGAPLVDVLAEVSGSCTGARCHHRDACRHLVRLVRRVLEQDDVHMTRGLGRGHQGA